MDVDLMKDWHEQLWQLALFEKLTWQLRDRRIQHMSVEFYGTACFHTTCSCSGTWISPCFDSKPSLEGFFWLTAHNL